MGRETWCAAPAMALTWEIHLVNTRRPIVADRVDRLEDERPMLQQWLRQPLRPSQCGGSGDG